MKPERYLIQFGGLSFGKHEFEFRVGGAFFKQFEYSAIEKADIIVSAILHKQNNVLTLEVQLNGTVGLDCDRCLKAFDFPIEIQDNIYIKNGDVAESNDTILVLPIGDTEADISQFIYELVLLSIPPRRVPCEIDSKKYLCDKVVLKKLKEIEIEEEPEEKNNPMWEKLNKIKFNNN